MRKGQKIALEPVIRRTWPAQKSEELGNSDVFVSKITP